MNLSLNGRGKKVMTMTRGYFVVTVVATAQPPLCPALRCSFTRWMLTGEGGVAVSLKEPHPGPQGWKVPEQEPNSIPSPPPHPV